MNDCITRGELLLSFSICLMNSDLFEKKLYDIKYVILGIQMTEN